MHEAFCVKHEEYHMGAFRINGRNIVILTKLTTLVAYEIVKMNTSSAVSDDNLGKITVFYLFA